MTQIDRKVWIECSGNTKQSGRDGNKKEAINPVDELNDLGASGWEVVTTIDYVGGGTKFIVCKRPGKRESESEDTDE